jgi:hypothetical protein
MDHFAGLDVSVYETSVCVVDDTARPTAQMRFRRLVRLPEALAALFTDDRPARKHVDQRGSHEPFSSCRVADRFLCVLGAIAAAFVLENQVFRCRPWVNGAPVTAAA